MIKDRFPALLYMFSAASIMENREIMIIHHHDLTLSHCHLLAYAIYISLTGY